MLEVWWGILWASAGGGANVFGVTGLGQRPPSTSKRTTRGPSNPEKIYRNMFSELQKGK